MPLKALKSAPNASKCLQNASKMPQNASKCPKIASKCLKSPPNASKCLQKASKRPQNASKCLFKLPLNPLSCPTIVFRRPRNGRRRPKRPSPAIPRPIWAIWRGFLGHNCLKSLYKPFKMAKIPLKLLWNASRQPQIGIFCLKIAPRRVKKGHWCFQKPLHCLW